MSKEITKAPSGRPTRKPVGHRDRLLVQGKDPNYFYRWVDADMDQGDRVLQFEQAGYEKVLAKDVKTANGRVDSHSPEGSFATIPGGDGKKLILMRQKKEWYDEDQKAKEALVRERDPTQQKTPEGFYGKGAQTEQ